MFGARQEKDKDGQKEINMTCASILAAILDENAPFLLLAFFVGMFVAMISITGFALVRYWVAMAITWFSDRTQYYGPGMSHKASIWRRWLQFRGWRA